MSCDACQRLLSQHVDGDLPPRLAGAVGEHLAGCAACARVAAELRALSARLRALPSVEPGVALWGRIDAALERDARARRPLLPMLAPVLGGLALVATATGAWLLQSDLRRRQAATDVEMVRAAERSLGEVERRWEVAEAEAALLAGEPRGAGWQPRLDRVPQPTLPADDVDARMAARSRHFFEVAERWSRDEAPVAVEPLRDPWPPVAASRRGD